MEARQKSPQRRGRGTPKPAARRPDAFQQFAGNPVTSRFGFLNDIQIEEFMSRSYDLLADYGVVVIHPLARKALIAAGARPGNDGDRLRLPRELVTEAVATTPKSASLAGKQDILNLDLPRADGGFIMRTGTGAHGYVDPRDASYRNLDLRAVREMAAVGTGL